MIVFFEMSGTLMKLNKTKSKIKMKLNFLIQTPDYGTSIDIKLRRT